MGDCRMSSFLDLALDIGVECSSAKVQQCTHAPGFLHSCTNLP